LLNAAKLTGQLEAAAQLNRWGRVWFLYLRSAMRTAIRQQYHALAHQCRNEPEKWTYLNIPLPIHMMDRLDSLVAQKVAKVVWRSHSRFRMTKGITSKIVRLHTYLANNENQ